MNVILFDSNISQYYTWGAIWKLTYYNPCKGLFAGSSEFLFKEYGDEILFIQYFILIQVEIIMSEHS